MADSTTIQHTSTSSAPPDNGGPPTDSSAPVPKSFKRRATISCSFCQWRKTRCNVEESCPCSNCAAEKIECRVTKRRKTKKEKSVANEFPPTRSAPADPPSAIHSLEPRDVEQHQQMDAMANSRQLPPKGSLSSMDDLPQSLNDMGGLLQGNTPQPTFSHSPSLHSGQSPSEANDRQSKATAVKPVLPSYIEPIPGYLSSDDIEYLHKKGSFNIPSDRFRDALVRSYAQFVHPYIPFLDIDEFLSDIVNLNGRGRKVSLLVFQAVLFTGSAHVDIKPLRMMGFLTRKAARRALYLRTKALYDLGYEQNRLQVIQTLVLMTLWSQSPDDQQDAWHWLQIAVSLARRAGLDKNPASMNMPESERRLRKRLWWCCLIRDPLLALGLKRPISILPDDHDVPELTVYDWDMESTRHEGLSIFGLDWDYQRFRLLRITCITEARLHRCLSNIMMKQYTLGDYHHGRVVTDQKATRAILLPVTTDTARRSMSDCEESLRLWRETLPTELASTTISPDALDASFDAFVLFRTVLHMVYHTCIITLYRPWIRPPSTSQGSSQDTNYQHFQNKFQTAVRTSAQCITELAVELHKADLARHLPQTALTAMVAAVVSHISDIACGDDTLRDSALRSFEQCSHILNELREHYYSADFTSDFVNLIARAKKLPRVTTNTEPVQNVLSHSFDFDEQSSAHKTFLAEGTPEVESAIQPLTRPLPEALFPQGIDVSLHLSPDWSSGADWNFESANMRLENQNQQGSPVDKAASLEYYRNFREESVSFLGDFLDDEQFGLFNSLLGIDFGG